MLLIVSNTGNWDHDMWGCVGAIPDQDTIAAHQNLMEFIDKDQKDNEDYSETDVEYVVGTDDCNKSMEENEVSCLCEGTPVAFAHYEQDGMFPDIYYIFEL